MPVSLPWHQRPVSAYVGNIVPLFEFRRIVTFEQLVLPIEYQLYVIQVVIELVTSRVD
jgi:hypothetical protein